MSNINEVRPISDEFLPLIKLKPVQTQKNRDTVVKIVINWLKLRNKYVSNTIKIYFTQHGGGGDQKWKQKT